MMKRKEFELDVDFIGGERLLTKEDEKAFSEYLKTKKMMKAKKRIHKTITKSQKKVVVT